jgi:uncharacterized protein (DUF1810 family)
MGDDPFQLSRFLEAQEASYSTALEEIRSGRKRSHWIWYVFPQLAGLGRSAMSDRYGLSGLAEARRYLEHPVLGARLREITRALVVHGDLDAESILGALDAAKVRSCLTLFSRADPGEPLFATALDRLYAGRPDPMTLERLRTPPL